MLLVLRPRKGGSSPVLQRKWFHGVKRPVNRREEIKSAACEPSSAVGQAFLLHVLEFFKHLHGLLKNNTLYALKNDKLLEWGTVQNFQLAVSALSPVAATVGNRSAHPPQIERPAVSCEKVVELNHEGIVVRGKALSAVQLSLEKSLSLVYGGEQSPIPKIKEIGSKKKRLLFSMILVGKKKRKTPTRNGSGEKDGVWDAGAEEVRTESNE